MTTLGSDRRRARRDPVPAARHHLLRRAARLRDQPCDLGDRHLSSDVGMRLVPEPDGHAGRTSGGAAVRVDKTVRPSTGSGRTVPTMILIVDDDPSVTASLALLLKQAGYASYAVAGARRRAGLARGESMRPRPAGHELLAADDRRGGHGAARADARGASDPARGADHGVGIDRPGRARHEGRRRRTSSSSRGPTSRSCRRCAPRSACRPRRRRRRAGALARGARRRVRLRPPRRRGPAAAQGAAGDRPRGADRRVGAHHGRERHRQGADRRCHPSQQPPPRPARS